MELLKYFRDKCLCKEGELRDMFLSELLNETAIYQSLLLKASCFLCQDDIQAKKKKL